MADLKLISARIDTETLKRIDAWLLEHRFWKRNAVINGILTAVVDSMTSQEIYDMVRYSRIHDEKPIGAFRHNGAKKTIFQKERA